MPNTTKDVEVISKQQLAPVFVKSHNNIKTKRLIEVSEIAYTLLEECKQEGYSFKRLASDAIINTYSKPVNLPPQKEDGDAVEFAARTVMAVGSARAALRSLDGYISSERHEFKMQVQDALMDMIERGCDRRSV